MNQNIDTILATLGDEKKLVTTELAKIEKERQRLLDAKKRIGRAIKALAPSAESKTVSTFLKLATVRELVAKEIERTGTQSEQTIKKNIAAKLKAGGGSRAGLTKHIRAIFSEPGFMKEASKQSEVESKNHQRDHSVDEKS